MARKIDETALLVALLTSKSQTEAAKNWVYQNKQ